MGVFAFLQQNSQKGGGCASVHASMKANTRLSWGSAPTPIFNREQPITREFPDLQPIFK
jgi:hypothetical protein